MGDVNKPLPDYCRDETAAIEHLREPLLTSNSVLLLIYGLTMGLVIGFSLGASANVVLVSGSYMVLLPSLSPNTFTPVKNWFADLHEHFKKQ
jgi:hypothetical protein